MLDAQSDKSTCGRLGGLPRFRELSGRRTNLTSPEFSVVAVHRVEEKPQPPAKMLRVLPLPGILDLAPEKYAALVLHGLISYAAHRANT